jgi:predicted N-acetyltransferase YhbS
VLSGVSIDLLDPLQIPVAVNVLARAFGETKPGQKANFARHLSTSEDVHFHALAAMHEGKMIGVITMGSSTLGDLPAIKLHNLAVDPDWQGKGIARALMLHAEELVKIECLSGKPGFILTYDGIDIRRGEIGFCRKLGYVPINPDIRQRVCKPLNGASLPGRKAL